MDFKMRARIIGLLFLILSIGAIWLQAHFLEDGLAFFIMVSFIPIPVVIPLAILAIFGLVGLIRGGNMDYDNFIKSLCAFLALLFFIATFAILAEDEISNWYILVTLPLAIASCAPLGQE